MRFVFGVLAILMVLAAAVQYNDPDGPLWMIFYGVPGFWAGLASIRPHALGSPLSRALLILCAVVFLVLTASYWPPAAGWWRNEVWSMSVAEPGAAALAEQAREGMGLMIATAVLLAVLAASFSGWRAATR